MMLQTAARTIPMLSAFLQGLLSFFSPCVLPLLPVYLTYLAGGGSRREENGEVSWPRGKVMVNTLCFVLGISFALILLGMTFTAIGQFFHAYQRVVQLICGIAVILFGLIQLGALRKPEFLEKDYRLPLRLDRLRVNPGAALLMGICFSFSWTPCVGPALSGILMTAAAASSRGRGILLMATYIVGFILPFLAVGLFTGSVLSFFRKHRAMTKWTTAVSGALLIVMGLLIMTGTMSQWSQFLASASAEEATAEETVQDDSMLAPDFTLKDQYGVEHTLSEYRGKTVFMNFWATWCPWCIQEMPEIEELYHEMGENQEDVVILGVAAPGTVDTTDEAGVISFLEEKGWTYPVVMDLDGSLFQQYYASSLPTTWIVCPDGTLLGYVPGAMSKEDMQNVIQMGMDTAGEEP